MIEIEPHTECDAYIERIVRRQVIHPPETLDAAIERIEDLERLILAMADKLATVAFHLGRLAEKRDS